MSRSSVTHLDAELLSPLHDPSAVEVLAAADARREHRSLVEQYDRRMIFDGLCVDVVGVTGREVDFMPWPGIWAGPKNISHVGAKDIRGLRDSHVDTPNLLELLRRRIHPRHEQKHFILVLAANPVNASNPRSRFVLLVV